MTEAEKKQYEETYRGVKDKLLAAWEQVKEFFTKVARSIAEWVKAFRKKIDEEAAAGNINAIYIKYQLETASYESQLEELEKKLIVTKKTTARRPLLDQQKFLKKKIAEHKAVLQESLAAAQEGKGRK